PTLLPYTTLFRSEPPAAGERLRGARDALLRHRRDRLGAGVICLTRLHFNDDENVVLPRRNVDFAIRRAQAVTENPIALAHQKEHRCPLRRASATLGLPAAHARSFSSSARA